MEEKSIIAAAKELLKHPQELQEIPIQRAVSALGINALTKGKHHKYYHVEYLIYPSNLYLTFDSLATRDKNGNYDSPIFQNDKYNGLKPLWQEFRERIEKKLGTSVSLIFFGEYKIGKNNDEFFNVKSEPKDCRWRYSKKPTKDSVFITSITEKQALEYQEILDEIRLERAIKTVKERAERAESRRCRKEAILSLNAKYPEEFDRFTLNEETFRFRQWTTEFLYTASGLAVFDDFYEKVCVPYRLDEIADAEWREKSQELQNLLLNDPELGSEFRFENVQGFKIKRTDNGGCEVESDLIDDRTGHPFHLIIDNQRFDDILNSVLTELVVVFQRKRQCHRATATLQSLASR